jgi:hypothetical protein
VLGLLPVALPPLIAFLQAWCLRHKDRSVTIKSGVNEIEFPPGGLSTEELVLVLERVGQPALPKLE